MMRQMVVALGLLVGFQALAAAVPDPPGAAAGMQGTLAMKGSDSMDPLVRLWLDRFQKANPGVRIQVESRGSGTAPPALISGEVRLGHMSREMSAEEQAAFQSRQGHAITRLVVALDALGIYVHRSNPVRRISLGQLDAIYSRTRLSGWDRPLDAWGDLGAGGHWRKREIHPFGRDEKSGTRSFFDDRILLKGGALKACYQIRDQWGVEEAVAQDHAGIGYGPANYGNPEVRLLPVLAYTGMYYLPSVENIVNGRYPLSRKLNIYVDKQPGQPLPAPIKAFLQLILGPAGQQLVQEYGSVPISKALAESQLLALEL